MTEITANMSIDNILGEYTKRLSKPLVKKLNKSKVITPISKFPLCSLRMSKIHDGILTISCGTRDLVNSENIEDLGFSLVLDECIKCGGYTSLMIKKIEYTFIKVVREVG